jgi:CSLREA domain-containing protein
VHYTLPVLLAAFVFLTLIPQRALAGGVVGNGTPGSCTETVLNTALVGGGSVTFFCGNAPVTILLSGEKVISADTTIDGGGRVTLDGNDAVRVFFINASAALTLTNLTISGGNGSGVANSGYGGGIFNNGGALTVINSTIADNNTVNDGGGVYNTGGPLHVLNSTFSDNTAQNGGGIEVVDSEAVVSNSTFSENSATNGGGIDVYADSGTPTLEVYNSTFSGNSASHTGGGIRNNGGTITLKNTIIANSTGTNCTTDSGTTTDGGGNLQYGGSTAKSCGATISTEDPKLGALADNGGPTWTMKLLAGSAALDSADDSTCATAPVNDLDQRGSPRSMDAQCDIGAYEYDASQTGPVFTVNDTGPTDDGVCGVGNCRLREAINTANLHAGADTVELATGATYTLTLVDNFDINGKGNGLPAITSDITINAHEATIARSQTDSTPIFRHFYVPAAGILRLNHGFLRGGSIEDRSGGSIFVNSGTLIILDSTVSNNGAPGGGGIYNTGLMTVTCSIFSDNAAMNGGGILNDSVITITRSSFISNGSHVGGGVYNHGYAIIANSTFSDNSGDNGGAIYNNNNLTVINSTISDNHSDGFGGIYLDHDAILKNTIVADNEGRNCYGPVIDGSGNLQYGGSMPDSCGASIPTGDPRLGALADNGGPTWTMGLGGGSAAINSADDATCAAWPVSNLDQRGMKRPVYDHCDVGAYEAEFPYALFLSLIRKE